MTYVDVLLGMEDESAMEVVVLLVVGLSVVEEEGGYGRRGGGEGLQYG